MQIDTAENRSDPVNLESSLAYLFDNPLYYPYDHESQLKMILTLLTSGEGFEKMFRDAFQDYLEKAV